MATISASVVLLGGGLALGLSLWTREPLPDPPVLTGGRLGEPNVRRLVEASLQEVMERPANAGVRARLAMVYQANGFFEAAATTWRQTLGIDDDPAVWWYHLAMTQAELGEYEIALTTLDEATRRDRDDQASIRWRGGLWLEQLGRLEEAASEFEAAARLAPDHPAGWMGLARVRLALDDAQSAAEIIQNNVLTRWSAYGDARRVLGAALRRLGHEDAARRELAFTHGPIPEWTDPWADRIANLIAGYGSSMKRAGELVERGDPQAAITLVNKFKSTHTRDPLIHNRLAEAHFAMNNPALALAELKRALEIDGRRVATHLNMSHAYEKLGEPARAMEHADYAVRLNSSSAASLLQQGRLLVLAGRSGEAIEPLTKAVRLGSVQPDVITMLGYVQLQKGRWDDAAASFGRVLDRYADHGSALVGMARARAERGEVVEARNLIEHARRVAPDERNLSAVADRIRQLERARR